ncbi:uncharacterized protein BO66DRAFT_388132 [Aspergillus aculeatinus CBS 121060]|uniref:Uncharacterized protein n=1 Tax=Aspergillus aculeatinus CBS 121060 TaxID=1448322 RepID=A0ACD1HMI3_9EURO|nr:hypothetical protein BO66DRAFT_388132 [Aspergillus aculeatinus CBS 121060]RAH74656.1 hypothetical protein BO66DRAFT_388132 [Aspergillus aculeatinus CBS 121060]
MFPAQLASSLRVGALTTLIIHVCPSLYVIVQRGLLLATLFTMETKSVNYFIIGNSRSQNMTLCWKPQRIQCRRQRRDGRIARN